MSSYAEQAESEMWDAIASNAPRPIVCERCRKGPHDDGYPELWTIAQAVDIGWSRTATGVLDEECAAEILANDYPRGA